MPVSEKAEVQTRPEAVVAADPEAHGFAASAGHGASPSGTRRKFMITGSVVGLVLIGCFSLVSHLKAREEDELARATAQVNAEPPTVDVLTVGRSSPTFPLVLPGETQGWYESVIYARVNGYVADWAANIGDKVRRGQVLATIETPDLDAQLTAAQARLTAAQALVVSRQSDVVFATATYERWKNSPTGVVSEQEREEKKAACDNAVAQLKEAQAQVGLARADVDRYTTLTEFKKVIAPYDGTITQRHIDIGNLVTAGSAASTTPLYRIVKDDPIRVFVDVPQSEAQDIRNGQPAEIRTSASAGRVFRGTVARTAASIDQKTRTLRVEVDIPNADHALVSGLYVSVTFRVPSDGAAQLPAAALIFRSGGAEVAMIGKRSDVEFRNVTISRDDGATVDVSSGVSVGDKIALNVGNQIADGAIVRTHALPGAVTTASTGR
ncbi:efflux RND transporter periplasmic adaptor subunit [Labrys monachus]|uniref:RND family efflux transporter MFP subunit n=1 Tax=Labrys monachus TaxID=217067 RepID=A0ABU0FDM2_9HYPH|nr:efflux RND transporter periplasmic adaptor subunit [Labrys monachus]MDQ0392707.1 RND family efflux transporter MFP subunit [Labrys monachus]